MIETLPDIDNPIKIATGNLDICTVKQSLRPRTVLPGISYKKTKKKRFIHLGARQTSRIPGPTTAGLTGLNHVQQVPGWTPGTRFSDRYETQRTVRRVTMYQKSGANSLFTFASESEIA